MWICPIPEGHIQAIGYDQRGRKQYRYHTLYRAVRDATKYERLAAFGAVLPSIRERVHADLRRPQLTREKVLATVVRLLEETCIRVGNEEYRKQNESFGLTTLRSRHVRIHGATLRFHFKGKSGQVHDIELTDRRLSRVIRECQCIPGHELFQYIDEDGERCRIESGDVNAYLREITGESFTAKDFRTWSGTRETVEVLEAMGPASSQSAAKKNIVEAVKQTSVRLGNRAATCRKYYVHPAVLDAYTDGSLFDFIRDARAQPGPHGLSREEVAMMRLLEKRSLEPLKKVAADPYLGEMLEESVKALAEAVA